MDKIFTIFKLFTILSWEKSLRILFRLQLHLFKTVYISNFKRSLEIQKIILKSNAARLLAIKKITQCDFDRRNFSIIF